MSAVVCLDHVRARINQSIRLFEITPSTAVVHIILTVCFVSLYMYVCITADYS